MEFCSKTGPRWNYYLGLFDHLQWQWFTISDAEFRGRWPLGVFVTALLNSPFGVSGQALVIAVNPDGTPMWERNFEINGDTGAQAVSASDKGVFVTGFYGRSPRGGIGHTFVRKYDFSGNEVWTDLFSVGESSQGSGILANATGGPYVVGQISGALLGQTQIGDTDAFVVKYLSDRDGDGVMDDVDVCPDEDATGFDANGDGCIDTLFGLTDSLSTLVTEGVVDETMESSLIANVTNAEKSADKDNICAAVNQLGSFKNQIAAQRGKKISDEAADLLTAYADNIIAVLLAQLPQGDTC